MKMLIKLIVSKLMKYGKFFFPINVAAIKIENRVWKCDDILVLGNQLFFFFAIRLI